MGKAAFAAPLQPGSYASLQVSGVPRGIIAGDRLERPEQMVGPLLQFAQDQGHRAPTHADDALICRMQNSLLDVSKKPRFATPGLEQVLEIAGQAGLVLQRRSMHMRPVRHPFHHLQNRRLGRFRQRAYFFVYEFRLIHSCNIPISPH